MDLLAFSTTDRFKRPVTNVIVVDETSWIDDITREYYKNNMKTTMSDFYTEYRLSTLLEGLQNPDYKSLQNVHIFTHYDEEDRDRFVQKHNIQIVTRLKCVEKQKRIKELKKINKWYDTDNDVPIGSLVGGVEKPDMLEDIPVQKETSKNNKTKSILDVSMSRSTGNNITTIVAKYKPEMVMMIHIPNDNTIDWDVKMRDKANLLEEQTNGECVFSVYDGRFAVPHEMVGCLMDIFGDETLHEVKKVDFAWEEKKMSIYSILNDTILDHEDETLPDNEDDIDIFENKHLVRFDTMPDLVKNYLSSHGFEKSSPVPLSTIKLPDDMKGIFTTNLNIVYGENTRLIHTMVGDLKFYKKKNTQKPSFYIIKTEKSYEVLSII